MSPALKAHLPVIALVAVLGILCAAGLLTLVRDNAGMFNAGMFTFFLIAIPCVVMLICGFAISVTAKEIGSRLLTIVVAICVISGFASILVVSGWQGDSAISAAVLANSPEGATLTPIINSPFGIVRNVMLYLLCPAAGCVAGAWVGSRLHPVSVDANNKKKPKSKPAAKKRRG